MVSINTNLSSLLVRNNLNKSTNALNQAIERMTTGFKINHASDNAANYSISQDMISKLSSYDVATDNISMGNDLVSTAQDSISLMQTHAERIHNLITQAMNGTYGEESQAAIASELNARIDEIHRLYATTEYNGIQLFNNQTFELDEGMPKAGQSGFIDESRYNSTVEGFYSNPVEYTDGEIAAMTKVKNLTKFISGQTYAVTDKEDLIKLAELQNAGKSTNGVTFVLGADIDLSDIDWNPIGDNNTNSNATRFRGTFNGNGHKITNLTVNNPDTNNQGMFGYVIGGNIKNLGIENANVSGKTYVGGLAGRININTIIENCYAESTVSATGKGAGGLVGYVTSSSTIKNCHVDSTVIGSENCGGLVGGFETSTLSFFENCYANSNVTGTGTNVGGLIGYAYNCNIANCYSEGNVRGINNCYNVGGFVGTVSNGSSISNSYSLSNVNGRSAIGGFCGQSLRTVNIDGCYSAGSVSGIKSCIGGFIGRIIPYKTEGGNITITNSNSYSKVSGGYYTGSFIGAYRYKNLYPDDFKSEHGAEFEYDEILTLSNCKSTNINGLDMIGGVCIANYIDQGYEDPETGEWVSASSSVTEEDMTFDKSALLSNISGYDLITNPISLQVGINGDSSSSITFDTNFLYNLSNITNGKKVYDNAYDIINNFMDTLSAKATSLGAVSNRLDSAYESTSVAMENLTSSLSTIRDADIAKESSAYIKAQILQQAAATLLATANQSPSIALQLL